MLAISNKIRELSGVDPRALPDDVLLRADADDVVERGAQRPFADPRDAAQVRHGDRFAEVVAQERVNTSDDLRVRHANNAH